MFKDSESKNELGDNRAYRVLNDSFWPKSWHNKINIFKESLLCELYDLRFNTMIQRLIKSSCMDESLI